MYRDGCIVDIMYDVNGKKKSASARLHNVGKEAEKVKLPFGTEFSIFLRNRNNYDVAVRLTLDGTSVLFNDSYIILPAMKSEMIEGFSNRDGIGGQRFKFLRSNGEEAQALGRTPNLTENGQIVAEFYKATAPVQAQIREKDILDKLEEIRKEVKEKDSQPYYPPYTPIPYPCPQYPTEPKKRHPDWYGSPQGTGDGQFNCSTNESYGQSSLKNNTKGLTIKPMSAGHFGVNDSHTNLYESNSITTGLLQSQAQEGVIESGSDHDQEWKIIDYTIGSLITKIELKILGINNTMIVCSHCKTECTYPNKFCSECGRSLLVDLKQR